MSSKEGAKVVGTCDVGMTTTKIQVSRVKDLLNYKPGPDEFTTVVAASAKCNEREKKAIKEYSDFLGYGFVDGTGTGIKVIEECDVGMITAKIQVSSVDDLFRYKPRPEEFTTIVAAECNEKEMKAIKGYADILDYGFVDGTGTGTKDVDEGSSGIMNNDTK